ncbi:MAG: class IV adenylate cyclase [Candidatus Thorarchaeota archaeon]
MGDSISIFEVEVKLLLNDVKAIESVLVDLGAKRTNSEKQIDIYLDHPCKSFGNTDEALRLRRRVNIGLDSVEAHNLPNTPIEMTYKGPKIDSTTKTRVELSVGIDDLDVAKALFLKLGFTDAATIKKNRIFYSHGGITVSIDDVEDIGTFLELECVVHSDELIPEAREEIFQLIESMGLNPDDSIRDSYLELYLKNQ